MTINSNERLAFNEKKAFTQRSFLKYRNVENFYFGISVPFQMAIPGPLCVGRAESTALTLF